MEIRLATPADAIAIRAIYAPIVSSTPISFELEPPTVEEMATRISAVLPIYPWLVLTDRGAGRREPPGAGHPGRGPPPRSPARRSTAAGPPVAGRESPGT